MDRTEARNLLIYLYGPPEQLASTPHFLNRFRTSDNKAKERNLEHEVLGLRSLQ